VHGIVLDFSACILSWKYVYSITYFSFDVEEKI
jgi:hypothetical protein